MKIKVQENVSYAEMSYIIDSTKLYKEVMKRYNIDLETNTITFYKNDQKIEPLQFTEEDVVAVYLDREGADWLEDYVIIENNNYYTEVWDYIFDLCCEVEDILAVGNRKVIYFSNISQISREEIKED